MQLLFPACLLVLSPWFSACQPERVPGGEAGRATISASSASSATTDGDHAAAPTNLLLVSLDTTRADRLGPYGYANASTPALDALAREGTRFERAYSPCPLTLPAHATLLTGLQPPEHGLRLNGEGQLGEEAETLASALAGRGYRTAAFVAAFVLDSKFGLGRGFDLYDDDLSDALPQEMAEELSRYRPGNVVVDRALKWLARGQSEGDEAAPFFAWVHLYDAHYPWHPHPEIEEIGDQASYDTELAFMDRQLGRLLAFLARRKLVENTLVVVVGDHGEGLGDHGDIEHGHMLNEEVLRVPLFFVGPDKVRPGHVAKSVVSLRDVEPTLRSLLGLPPSAGGGRDLSAALSGGQLAAGASYAETNMPYSMFGWSPQRSLTTAKWKYVRSARPELYNLEEDRAEIFNLALARPEEAARMETALAEKESTMKAPLAVEAVTLSKADRERLESLGYAGSAAEVAGTTANRASDESSNQVAGLESMRKLRDIKDMLAVKHRETDLLRAIAFGAISKEQVVEVAQKLVHLSPESSRLQQRLGFALLEVDRTQDALAAFEAAQRNAPDLAEPRMALGRLHLTHGRPALAREHFDAVLARDPANAQAIIGVAEALAAMGARDSALGYLHELLRQQPGNAALHARIARMLQAAGRVAAALTNFARAVELDEDDPRIHFDFAAALASVGRQRKALLHFQRAREALPGNPDLLNDMAVTQAALGLVDEAIATSLVGLRAAPNHPRLHYNLANTLAQQGQYADAIDHYESAMEARPEWGKPAERLAWLLATCENATLRDPGRAVTLAESATQNRTRLAPRPMATLAEAYASAGRSQEAAATGRLALSLARASNDAAMIANLEREVAARNGRK